MDWADVYRRIAAWALPDDARVYGVPRGGAVVAGLTGKAVGSPGEATVLVDDIVDSGRTRARIVAQWPGVPFLALVERGKPGDPGGWVVFPWESPSEGTGEDVVVRLLELIGEDPTREGLRETPARVVRSWRELYGGYGKSPADVVKVFVDGACNEMVTCKGISFVSTCEHHMLPFCGTVHIGYIPAGKVIGLSKLARIVEIYARRLQVQERLTTEIAEALMSLVQPQGVMVVCEAQHLCMVARGVQKAGSMMVTSAIRGRFQEQAPRSEFLALIEGR